MFLIALLSALPVFSAYSLCSTSDVKGPITIPIENVLVTSPIVANGNIVILNGCTFEVTGFSLSNAGTARWYGGMGTSLDGINLSDAVINPNPSGGKQTFTFRSVAGAAVSFRDFNQFRLFDTTSNTLIAIANVPSNILASGAPVTRPIATTGTIVATRSPTTATTSSRTTSATASATSNADFAIVPVNGILAALMLVVGF